MSRSYRHTPVRQMCSNTQKEWRSSYNRCLRHHNKIRTRDGRVPKPPVRGEEQPNWNEEPNQQDWEDQIWLQVREVGDIWTSPSDGWVSYWDYWSERKKKSPWTTWRARLDPERKAELEKADAEREERLKWRLFMK